MELTSSEFGWVYFGNIYKYLSEYIFNLSTLNYVLMTPPCLTWAAFLCACYLLTQHFTLRKSEDSGVSAR